MDIEEQTHFVLQEMRRHRKADDIIYGLCEQTGGKWNDVAPFVHKVIAENKDKVQEERQPLIAAIGVALVVAGLGGVIGVTIATLDGWIIIPLRLPIPYLGNAMLCGASAALIIGGMQGLVKMAFFTRKPDGE